MYRAVLRVLTLSFICVVGTMQTPAQTPRLIAPVRIHDASRLPVVVAYTQSDGGFDRAANTVLPFGTSDVTPSSIAVRRGAGTALLSSTPTGDLSLRLVYTPADTLQRTVTIGGSHPVQQHGGTLSGASVVWDNTSDHLLTEDVVIPEGTTLRITEGALVRLAEKVNIIAKGRLLVEGSEAQPVAFVPEHGTRPWGGIIVEATTAEFRHCFFTGGGGDTSRVFNHSGSQAVLMMEHSSVRITSCFFVYNTGKALGSRNSDILCEYTVISHCDTGGEFEGGSAFISHSLVKDIPDGDGVPDDDDNDGFYFLGRANPQVHHSLLLNTTITGTEDDCVDHNGMFLIVSGCLLEGAYHEGVAASMQDTVVVSNTVVRNCEQGIEAGYGSPLVLVDHCLVTDNDVGLRFGDSYEADCSGMLRATNSVLYGNTDNVRNFELKTGGPVPGAISTRYCITNDPEYNDSAGCLAAAPLPDQAFMLTPSSAGYAAGMAGATMGIRPSLNTMVVTELFHDPAVGNQADWMELYNADVLPLDLRSWYFVKDGATMRFPGVIVPPQSFIVLCRDTSVFRARYSHPVRLTGNLPFDIGRMGSITINFALGAFWGLLSYDTVDPWPIPVPNGSIYLPDPHSDYYNGGNWRSSGPAGGTPGYYQHQTNTNIPEPRLDTLLRITPLPFGDNGVLSYTIPAAGYVEIILYDIGGRPVSTLVDAYLSAGSYTVPLPSGELTAGAFYAVLRINGTTRAFTGGIHVQND